MVKCEICGNFFKWISNTHLKQHCLTVKEYQKKFPDGAICSEENLKMRSQIMMGKNIGNDRPDARRRMINENPMKNKDVCLKMGETRRDKIASGKIDALKELIVQNIFVKHGIPLTYVGDGQKWLGNHCPDFVCEERKIVLELDLDFMRHEEEKKFLKEHYQSYGYFLILLATVIEKDVVNWVNPFFQGARWVKIKNIRKEKTKGRKKVYNFHVSPNNNYFADRFLVHNCFADSFRASLYTSFFDNSKTLGIRYCKPEFFKPELDNLLNGKGKGEVARAIKLRIPARIGIRFEDFFPLEGKRGIAKELLKYLADVNYPVMINTKSDLVGREDYVAELVRNKAGAAVHITMISSDEELLKKLEPGAPSFEKRLQAARALSDAGIRVVARIEPFMVFVNDEKEKVDEYCDMIWQAGVRHITFDTYSYSASNRGIRRGIEMQGIDFDRMFMLMSDAQWLGSLLLNRFMDYIRVKGFQCSTFDFGSVPDNDDDICCCVGDWFDGGFNAGNVLSAVRYIVKQKRSVTWNEYEKWVETNGGFLSDSLGRMVFESWNLIGNKSYSPDWARGIEPVGQDNEGRLVWKYNQQRDFRLDLLESII